MTVLLFLLQVVSKPAVYPVYQHNKDELPCYPGPQTEAGQPGEPQYSSQAPPYTGNLEGAIVKINIHRKFVITYFI